MLYMKPLIISIFLVWSTYLISQNYLFKPGQSGAHTYLKYDNIDDQNNYSFNLGYTFNSRLTLNLIGTHSKRKIFDRNSYGAEISFLILKEDAIDAPFSLSLDGSYKFGNYRALSRFNIYNVGSNIYKRFIITSRLSIIPAAGVDYYLAVDKSPGFSLNNDYWGYELKVSGLMNQFSVTPSWYKIKNISYLAVSLGFIFPL